MNTYISRLPWYHANAMNTSYRILEVELLVLTIIMDSSVFDIDWMPYLISWTKSQKKYCPLLVETTP